jgi:hypothetical protein
MYLVNTVSCKLEVDEKKISQLEAALVRFAEACDFVQHSTPATLKNTLALQALVYQEVRKRFGLSANLTIQAIRRVGTARSSKDLPPSFAPTSISYDARIFSFRERDWTASLTLLKGRERFILELGNYQRGLLKGQYPSNAVLIKRKDGTYYLAIRLERHAEHVA